MTLGGNGVFKKSSSERTWSFKFLGFVDDLRDGREGGASRVFYLLLVFDFEL